jgi:hypothetical protein
MSATFQQILTLGMFGYILFEQGRFIKNGAVRNHCCIHVRYYVLVSMRTHHLRLFYREPLQVLQVQYVHTVVSSSQQHAN